MLSYSTEQGAVCLCSGLTNTSNFAMLLAIYEKLERCTVAPKKMILSRLPRRTGSRVASISSRSVASHLEAYVSDLNTCVVQYETYAKKNISIADPFVIPHARQRVSSRASACLAVGEAALETFRETAEIDAEEREGMRVISRCVERVRTAYRGYYTSASVASFHLQAARIVYRRETPMCCRRRRGFILHTLASLQELNAKRNIKRSLDGGSHGE